MSAKNPNVMFELGMRLAFDKPTVIVKDEQTSYSFDTSPIEHLTYPRDLRFTRITEFKLELTNRIQSTAKAAMSDSNYSTFLKHFGKFSVAKLDSTEVSRDQYIIEELRELRSYIRDLGVGRRVPRSIDAKSVGFDTRMLDSIADVRKELKLDSFSQLQLQKIELRNRIESYASEYFVTETDYYQAFDRLWDSLFGSS